MQAVITAVGRVGRAALMAGGSGPVAQALPKASCMLRELKESNTLLSASLPASVAKFRENVPKDPPTRSQPIRTFPSTCQCVGFQPQFLTRFHSGPLL